MTFQISFFYFNRKCIQLIFPLTNYFNQTQLAFQIYRQLLRETWANTTEFNYSKFAILHAHLNDTYLPINDRTWKNFTIQNNNDIDDDDDDASQANFRIRVAFLVGQTENNTIQEQIVQESEMYDDMIQESFQESYYNLTLKAVLMMKWVVNNGCEGKGEFFFSDIMN